MSNPSALPEALYFMLGRDGAVTVFQEKQASYSSLLAFSSEAKAREFCRQSQAPELEIVALPSSDEDSLGAMIRQLKGRGVRYLVLDLDHRRGDCVRYELVGQRLGPSKPYQFSSALS